MHKAVPESGGGLCVFFSGHYCGFTQLRNDMTLKSCLKSMRLRTLPLSLAGVLVGLSLASSVAVLNIPTAIALLLTTALLQILSNLSNELGDTLHSTDTSERQGIHYSIQDGEMTIPQMKRLIAVILVICCFSGLAFSS